MNRPLPEELLSGLGVLGSEDIDLVTDYVRGLKEKRERLTNRKELMSPAGSMPTDEMEQIRAAIGRGLRADKSRRMVEPILDTNAVSAFSIV